MPISWRTTEKSVTKGRCQLLRQMNLPFKFAKTKRILIYFRGKERILRVKKVEFSEFLSFFWHFLSLLISKQAFCISDLNHYLRISVYFLAVMV